MKLPASYGLVAVMIGSALNNAMIPVFGAISDRIGRKKTLFFVAGVIIVSAWRALRVFSKCRSRTL